MLNFKELLEKVCDKLVVVKELYKKQLEFINMVSLIKENQVIIDGIDGIVEFTINKKVINEEVKPEEKIETKVADKAIEKVIILDKAEKKFLLNYINFVDKSNYSDNPNKIELEKTFKILYGNIKHMLSDECLSLNITQVNIIIDNLQYHVKRKYTGKVKGMTNPLFVSTLIKFKELILLKDYK